MKNDILTVVARQKNILCLSCSKNLEPKPTPKRSVRRSGKHSYDSMSVSPQLQGHVFPSGSMDIARNEQNLEFPIR